MASVTPTTPFRGFPCSSFDTPANFTKRGTGNAGTISCGTRTARSGVCGSAAADRCCAWTRATPKPKTNTKPTPVHLMIRFMGSLLLSAAEDVQIFLWSRCGVPLPNEDDRGKLSDDPENYANPILDFVRSQLNAALNAATKCCN